MFNVWNSMFDGNEASKAWTDNMKKMYDVNSFSEGAKAWNDNFQKFYGGKEDAFKA